MLYNKLTTKERLTKIKIQLQDEQPFWAYLILKLQMQEDTKGYLPPYAGMGVNAWGKMYWKKEFVDNLNDNELKFVLAHEVGHLVFAHLIRKGVREVIPFNVAADIVLNDVLCHNNFIPPKDFLLPKNHEITLGKVVIKDTDKKTAEEVYDEIPRENFPNGQGYNFDDHSYDDNMSESEKAKVKEKWKDATMEAAVYSKQRGKLPGGMESIIGDLMNPKFNWKQLLRKFITNTLPFDYSFSRPNRKIPGYILPGVMKETVDIVVHIDTSGSISNKELNEFMSEIIGIATSHQNLNMTLIECDSEIQQIIEVNSRNISKLKNVKIKGRGGTSHKPVWDYLKKKKPHCKLFVSLTDLYSDIELSDKPRCNVIFITPSGDYVVDKSPFGKILKLR